MVHQALQKHWLDKSWIEHCLPEAHTLMEELLYL